MTLESNETWPPNEGDPYAELKVSIHHRLLDSIDLGRANKLDRDALERECDRRVRSMLDAAGESVPAEDRPQIQREILDEIFGLGPLEKLMGDEEITDILVNGPDSVFIERHGRLERLPIAFRDDEHLLNIIRRIIRFAGRRLDEKSPMVDTRLADGSRINAVIPPLAIDGPLLSIRRFGSHEFSIKELVRRGMLAAEMADFLNTCVHSRLNIIVSGGSGAGKTTLLNALSAAIPDDQRVVTIEDAAELCLRQQHVVRMETRPANIEGSGEITTRDVVRNALRMRPDRILVGECRGEEAFDMLQAMNSGHSGSMTTMHANGPVDAFRRLESMLCMAGMEMPVSVLREYVGSAINLVVQVERLANGDRRVVSIAEVLPLEGGAARIEEIFRFRVRGIEGCDGVFEATGHIPLFTERLATLGLRLERSAFEARELVPVPDFRKGGVE